MTYGPGVAVVRTVKWDVANTPLAMLQTEPGVTIVPEIEQPVSEETNPEPLTDTVTPAAPDVGVRAIVGARTVNVA